MTGAFRPYKSNTERKTSSGEANIPWLTSLPEHWDIVRSKRLFATRKERAREDDEQLSATQAYGVIPQKDFEGKVGRKVVRINQHLEKRAHVEPDDFVISMRSFQGGLERAWARGCIRSSYVVLQPSPLVHIGYFAHLFKCQNYISALQATSNFIRDGQDLNFSNFCLVDLPLPPQEEQDLIGRFLDWNSARVNKFIRNKRRLIELLKEQRQNVINQAVTRGLDPRVKFKLSGVEWIGDIPEHWGVRKLKHIAAMKSGDNLTSDQIAEAGEYPVYGGNGLRGYFNNYNKDGKYLLVGRQGALCGNVHRVEGKFWATEHAVVTDVHSKISTDWYYYMLTVMNLNQYSESAAQPGISVEKIQNLRTALPSLKEQEAIVIHIERETATIDYTISRAQREIELMREYRTRLISDVVTGQVDVRGIEVQEVAEDELLALEEDTADGDDVIDDEGKIDETD